MAILHHHPLDPFSRRVRLTLAELGLSADLVEEKPGPARPELLTLNPSGTVPVLLDDDGTTTRYEFMQLIHETAINWNTSANFDEKTFLIRVEQTAFAATELARFGLISEDVTD